MSNWEEERCQKRANQGLLLLKEKDEWQKMWELSDRENEGQRTGEGSDWKCVHWCVCVCVIRKCICVYVYSCVRARNVSGPDFGLWEYHETVFPSLGPVYSP